MKNTFYAFILLFLCAGFAAAADSAVKQAHRANADGAITNATGNTPEALRHGAGLNFDTANPVKVTKQGKGPVKGYTYTKPNGTTYNVDLNNDIPQPSEAVDATDENSPDKYARKRNNPLRNYEVVQEEPISKSRAKAKAQEEKVYKYLKPGEENLPEEEKDRLEKSRAQAAKRKAEKEEWVDPITQAKTQEEVREILQKEWLTPELKQVLKGYGVSEDEFIDRMIASHKEYQRSDYTAPKADTQPAQNANADEQFPLPMTQGMRMLLNVKGIKPENVKPANNQPVNTQVKTVKKFKLAADIIQADKRLSEKEKQEFLEWDAKIRRQAEELKAKERQEAEKRLATNVTEEDIKYGKFDQICAPKIKNASRDVCALCCMHPQTTVAGFDPNTQVMVGGYIDRDECHCHWQGKPLTGYSTRNTSQQACNAYCLAHPRDTKGFNPDKHQMHYGKLTKGECKCHYTKKEEDICSWKVSTSSNEACTRCCIEQPGRNRHNAGFDPSIHTMLDGRVIRPGLGANYCQCGWVVKPEMRADEHAAVAGLSVTVPSVDWNDDAYTKAVCDRNFVNQTNGNCTKCCLAKNPSAPRIGHVLDYGYINNGQCKCHFSNPNAGVCDNERKLASDGACYECCKAQPPIGFDSDTDEMDYGRVVGNNCECHWKTRPQETAYDEPGCSFEEKNRSQSDCNRCCTDPSRGLVGGELESDGICVCLHR